MSSGMQDIYSQSTRSAAISQYMSKVYLWMTVGIVLTGAIAFMVSEDQNLLMTIVSNRILFYGLMIAEFGLVMWLSARIDKLSALAATSMFLLYAAINGATLSIISLMYTSSSIQSAFMTSAISFAGLSVFGYVTKKDLGPVGSFCTMGLFGLVGFSLISIFFPSVMGTMASQIYGLVGIIVFAGLTAYDTQVIKSMAPASRDAEQIQKGAIIGALKLYLDFVNLFLFILRFSGDRRK